MSESHPYQRKSLDPLESVLIVLIVATVGGGMLLLSAARPTAPVDGAVDWREGSVLRAIVELLCLNHKFPTEYAGDVKNYLLGLGAGLAALAFGIGALVRRRGASAVESEHPAGIAVDGAKQGKAHVAPLRAAQVLIILYVGWAFASSRWARTAEHTELAIGAAAWLAIQFLWSMTLGFGLSQRATAIAARAIVVILVMTAIVAVWYHYGRKPLLRAEFPVGNPSFVAVCLIPGITLALGFALEKLRGLRCGRTVISVLAPAVLVASIGLMMWAFVLADSRGAYVGLVFSVLAMAFLLFRGWVRLVPLAIALLVIVGGVWYLATYADLYSPTNRHATLRLRMYAWSYAWRMFVAKPLTGHGLGGFTLYGDAEAAEDVLGDPLALENRLAHAHNEWIEVLADLGSVGLVLVAGAILLTLHAGAARLNHAVRDPYRFALVGLLGALVGVVVAESFSVGLRVSAVPTIFGTVLGLIWAMSRQPRAESSPWIIGGRTFRTAAGIGAAGLGLGSLVLAHQDFAAARNVRMADEALARGEYESAVAQATLANERRQLHPQRVLTNLFRLVDSHLLLADHVLGRALDRHARASGSTPPNTRLLLLAEDDFRMAAAQCDRAASVLTELLVLSPGFIHHGKLAYHLNLLRAQLASVRGEQEKESAFLESAGVALERELRRQPYDPELAAAYVHVLGPSTDTLTLLRTLAPPIRRHRITTTLVEVLSALSGSRDVTAELLALESRIIASSDSAEAVQPEWQASWAPELLRLIAAMRFLRGDYSNALGALRMAAERYEAIWTLAPVGAASCFAELADCSFFANPQDPAPAIAAATRALTLAPQSREGRELRAAVLTRLINYRLAAGEEGHARSLLVETAPGEVTEAELAAELGIRYRRLCESLLGRRDAGGVLRLAPDDLLPKLQTWIARAIELNPDDAGAHLVLADLAFHDGQDERTAAHLRHAVDLGLGADMAIAFLRAARDRHPESTALGDLLKELEQRAATSPDSPSTGPAPNAVPPRDSARPIGEGGARNPPAAESGVP
jgi:O-antigen ligase